MVHSEFMQKLQKQENNSAIKTKCELWEDAMLSALVLCILV